MKIGISTYAFLWQFSNQAKNPLTVMEMLSKTKQYGAEVFQICDYPPSEDMNESELLELASEAHRLNIELELGTRGVHPDHLRKYLRMAKALNVKMLRTMMNDKVLTPSFDQAVEWIKEVLPEFVAAEVTIALETYEQVKTTELLRLVKIIDSPYVGICLDPGNCIAALEVPEQVISNLAPYVVNLHVKDFKFTRRDSWVGFALVGCPLGDGLLDLDFMLDSLARADRNPNAIIELWLPFEDTIEKTIELENQWIELSIQHLRRKVSC